MHYLINNRTGNPHSYGSYAFQEGESRSGERYPDGLPTEVVTNLELNPFIDIQPTDSLPAVPAHLSEVKILQSETDDPPETLFDQIKAMVWGEAVDKVGTLTDIETLQALANLDTRKSVREASKERLSILEKQSASEQSQTSTENPEETGAGQSEVKTEGENNPDATEKSDTEPPVNG